LSGRQPWVQQLRALALPSTGPVALKLVAISDGRHSRALSDHLVRKVPALRLREPVADHASGCSNPEPDEVALIRWHLQRSEPQHKLRLAVVAHSADHVEAHGRRGAPTVATALKLALAHPYKPDALVITKGHCAGIFGNDAGGIGSKLRD